MSKLNWVVVNTEGRKVAVLDSQSEAYWFTKNRGHAENAVYVNEGLDYGAAPDLLAACQQIISAADDPDNQNDRDFVFAIDFVKLRAAVLKAGGGK